MPKVRSCCKNEYWSASTIIQPSQQFNYNQWIKSDYDEIQKGLLPNAANASDQLATAYSVYNANLEQEVDLFSYGLIGFRPREYMQALNLDDVSQVGLYQQFLGTKGTVRSAELFSLADLGKEIAQYDIYEIWAMQRATYGATANRNYIEVVLDSAKLRSDPSLVQIINPEESSQADQTVLVQNIWKTSSRLTGPDIFPTTLTPVNENSLPTAGYVNLDDVDYTVFSFEDPAGVAASIDQELTQLSLGDTIWTAKANAHDWNVYRVREVPGRIISVSDNLDGRCLVEFSRQHQLQVNNYVIIKFFNPAIDGTYRVVSVPGLQSVLINLVLVGDQTEITGSGVGFTLDTARVAGQRHSGFTLQQRNRIGFSSLGRRQRPRSMDRAGKNQSLWWCYHLPTRILDREFRLWHICHARFPESGCHGGCSRRAAQWSRLYLRENSR